MTPKQPRHPLLIALLRCKPVLDFIGDDPDAKPSPAISACSS
ncbi:hypothetical protein ACFSUK_14240 [Sphingobium scionense]